jgi:3D (Asp-Asp-Asp) domain-containing protein
VTRLCALVILIAVARLAGAAEAAQLNGRYLATAYSQTGITASGEWTHRHIVAADPSILPIGTRVKIKHAGRYSGEYVVADTGAKVEGRHLDLYVPSTLECKKFGVKRVSVRVIELGAGTHEAAKQADNVVKQDVKQDVEKGVVGNAATEHDWATQGGAVAKAVKEGGTPADAASTGTGSTKSQKSGAASSTSPSNSSGQAPAANGGTSPPPER